MALLSSNEDKLKYDPLRYDSLRDSSEYDPLGETQSNRIRQYDADLGYAAHPEEKAAALGYKGSVDASVADQQEALGKYKDAYKVSMAEADKESKGLLASIKNIDNPQEKIAVSIIGNDQLESTHYVSKEWADSFLPPKEGYRAEDYAEMRKKRNDATTREERAALSEEYSENSGLYGASKGVWTPTQSEDGTWKIDAGGYGEELRDLLTEAEFQTGLVDEQYAAANADIDKTRLGADESIASSRGIAQANYDQQVSQADTTIENTRGLWTTYNNDQQTAFATGVETNTGGIKDLVDSGALVRTGGIA